MHVLSANGNRMVSLALAESRHFRSKIKEALFFQRHCSRLWLRSDRRTLPRWLREDWPRDREHPGHDEKPDGPAGSFACEGEAAHIRANPCPGKADIHRKRAGSTLHLSLPVRNPSKYQIRCTQFLSGNTQIFNTWLREIGGTGG